MHKRHEMLDLVVDGKARGIIARDLVTGEIERHSAHAVVILEDTETFSFLPMRWVLTLLQWKIQKGFFANPCYTQIHHLYPSIEITKLN
jgi:succinate dehydrogenase / fumarate reductase flavoprotein subunit